MNVQTKNIFLKVYVIYSKFIYINVLQTIHVIMFLQTQLVIKLK